MLNASIPMITPKRMRTPVVWFPKAPAIPDVSGMSEQTLDYRGMRGKDPRGEWQWIGDWLRVEGTASANLRSRCVGWQKGAPGSAQARWHESQRCREEGQRMRRTRA